MTITMNRLLSHMSWANQKTIAHLQTLPKESLSAFATNPQWQVAEILHHIVEAADAYAFRISGKAVLSGSTKPGVVEIAEISDLEKIKAQALEVDKALLACVDLDDVQIEFKNYSGNLVKRWRSTILSQSIHHATEHRAQIASALEAKGFTPVDLDELDLWAFEIEAN
jgi:uncharacterized damage-inducible protein DinB